ncbi:MAG: FtsX-like permease family protein [Candidatus Hermodarchaeia archaeon]
MYRYAVRRTTRNKKLIFAILIGVLIATTLFAASNIGANSMMGAMLYDVLDTVAVDMSWQPWGSSSRSDYYAMQQEIESVPEVISSELMIRDTNYTSDNGDEQILLTNGVQNNSAVYNGMTLISGTMSLEANQTLITASSSLIADYPIGSNYSIYFFLENGDLMLYNLTLEVVGHVEVTAQAQEILLFNSYLFWGMVYESWIAQHVTFFIVDVESTFLPVYDFIEATPDVERANLDSYINFWIDRTTLINPYNIQQSSQALQQLGYQIQNSLNTQGFDGWVQNEISNSLFFFAGISESFRVVFLQVSIPVFFIALYMGITLNDVSYSIRRREVGLLLTKGVTRSTITSLFVWEALLVGLFASILGILLAIFLIPFFISTVTWVSIFTTGIGVDTIFLTIMFGVILAIIASYLPARKASKIPTTEAIREYTTAGESMEYRKMLAWTALILGSYKIIIWLLGISVQEIVLQLMFTNPIFGSLAAYWLIFDSLISFWAPLLFLWGLTTIIVKGWKGFYQYSQSFISRILGELGGLASHNIRRRPGRTAAIIFITALLLGYSVQTVGILGTSQDLAVRDAFTSVGADLSVLVSHPENVSDLLPTIRAIDGVRGAAGELTLRIETIAAVLDIRAINVSEWLDVAYWEPGWISGLPPLAAFELLGDENQTIILEKEHAVGYGVDIGDQFSVQFSSMGSYHPLTIVGYMGPDPEYYQDPWGGGMWLAQDTWSYVPIELVEEFSNETNPTGHILVTLDSPINNAAVIQAIEALDDVLDVDSAITNIEEYNANVLLSSTTNMMQMGVIFALLLASVGTFVIIYLTLRERRTTTALMSARGMTYSQTVIILMAEILTIMMFAILIGYAVGLIIYYGLVSGGTTSFEPQLLVPQFLAPSFLGMFLLQTGLITGMLMLATLIPILIEARVARYDLSVLR